MITWLKLFGSALIATVLYCCDNCYYHFSPVLNSVSPNVGTQGTDVVVTLIGAHFGDPDPTANVFPYILIDGVNDGGNDGLSTTFNARVDPWTETSITFTLHIDATARAGAHTIAVQANGVTSPLPFSVTCPGAPPPPELINIENVDHVPLVPGSAVTFQVVGINFSINSNLQVQTDRSDISFPSGPYNVQEGGGTDYFSVLITADANARPGDHEVWVSGDCGQSLPVNITVDASQPPPGPSPGGPPKLNGITPMLITQIAAGSIPGTVAVKCEGSGFGIEPQIVVDQNNTIGLFAELPTYQANPDQVVVGLTTPFPGGTDTSVTVRVQNTQTGMTSNALILHLAPPNAGAPFVQDLGNSVPLNGDQDFTMFGQNLEGVTAKSFSVIPGVTFSNVQPDPDPRYPPGTAIDFHVHVDGSAPVTGDEATNLTITTSKGQSNPFVLEIYSPP